MSKSIFGRQPLLCRNQDGRHLESTDKRIVSVSLQDAPKDKIPESTNKDLHKSTSVTSSSLDYKLRVYHATRKTNKRRILYRKVQTRHRKTLAAAVSLVEWDYHKPNLNQMPFELLGRICSFLNYRDHHGGFVLVSRYFSQVSRERESHCPVVTIAWDLIVKHYPPYVSLSEDAKRTIIDSPIFHLQVVKCCYNNGLGKNNGFAPTTLILHAQSLPIQLHVMFLILLDRQQRDNIKHLRLASCNNTDDYDDDEFENNVLFPLIQQIATLCNLESLHLDLKSGSHTIILPLVKLHKLEKLEELLLGPHIRNYVDIGSEDGDLANSRGELLSWFPKLRRLEIICNELKWLLYPFNPAPFSERSKTCMSTPCRLESFTWKNLGQKASDDIVKVLKRFQQQYKPIPLKKFCIEFTNELEESLDMDPWFDMLFRHANTMRVFEFGFKSAGVMYNIPDDRLVSANISKDMPAAFIQLCLRQERARGMHKLKSHLTPYNGRVYPDDKPLQLETLVIARVIFQDDMIMDLLIRFLMAFPSLEHLVLVDCGCDTYQKPRMMLSIKTPYSIQHPEIVDADYDSSNEDEKDEQVILGPNAPLSVSHITDDIGVIMDPAWAKKIKFMSKTQFDLTSFN